MLLKFECRLVFIQLWLALELFTTYISLLLAALMITMGVVSPLLQLRKFILIVLNYTNKRIPLFMLINSSSIPYCSILDFLHQKLTFLIPCYHTTMGMILLLFSTITVSRGNPSVSLRDFLLV